jgi:hypothetical protein
MIPGHPMRAIYCFFLYSLKYIMGVQTKRDKIMNTHTIKSNACKHYENSHM